MDEIVPAPEAPTMNLIAKPETRYVLHCSHCGYPYEGEFGPALFAADVLTNPGRYAFTDDNWQLDIDGRALVCPTCFGEWCEVCSGEVHAWSPQVTWLDGEWRRVRHEACDPEPVVAAGSGGEEGQRD